MSKRQAAFGICRERHHPAFLVALKSHSDLVLCIDLTFFGLSFIGLQEINNAPEKAAAGRELLQSQGGQGDSTCTLRDRTLTDEDHQTFGLKNVGL